MTTPRLTPETEAEIARECAIITTPKPDGYGSAYEAWNESHLGALYRARQKHVEWLPALLAELQALREERDALDTWGRRLMAVEQERRAGLTGLDELRGLSEAATPGRVIVDDMTAYGQGLALRTASPPVHYGVVVARHMTEADAQWFAAAVACVRALLAVDPRPAVSPPDRLEG